MLGRPARLRSWPGVGRLSARSCIVAPEEIFSAGTRAITPSIPARTAWVLFWSSDMAVGGLGFSMPSALVSSAAPAVGPSPGVDCSAPICALACKKDGDEVQRREGPRLSILLGPLNPSAIYNLQSPLHATTSGSPLLKLIKSFKFTSCFLLPYFCPEPTWQQWKKT